MEQGIDLTQLLQKGSRFWDRMFSALLYLFPLIVLLIILWLIIHYLKMRRKIKQAPKSIQDVATDSLEKIKKLRSQTNTIISHLGTRRAPLHPATATKLQEILDQGQSIVKEMQRRLASLQQRVADKESNLPDTLVNRFSDSTAFVSRIFSELKIAIESLPIGEG